jgi:hypothetical protein
MAPKQLTCPYPKPFLATLEEIERLETLDKIGVIGFHQNGKAIRISNGDQDGNEAESDQDGEEDRKRKGRG